MEEFIRKVVPIEMNSMEIEVDNFMALYNEGKRELLDDIKYLTGGLTGLTEYLKGGKAKMIKC